MLLAPIFWEESPQIFGLGLKNENLKSALLTTTPPLLGEKSWWTMVL